MNIGEVARQSGVPVKTIRYYEAQGLVPLPPRQANGYRDYSSSSVSELTFLRQARQFGFSLEECRHLLALWHNPNRRSAEVHDLVVQRQKQVAEQIAELKATHKMLSELLTQCAGDDSPECAIIDNLSDRSVDRGEQK